MDTLAAFGLFSVTAMLVCYALERRSPWYILGFAVACGLGSIYGFLQGAWPFGLVELVWAMVAARRWWLERQSVNAGSDGGRGRFVVIRKVTESP
jgi:4-amino-4-deoxy-L-arabinose transferase-like glycosyltransferase